MKIDRHNYEEYFLLYIDNELNVDQKKQVELFIKENPDLEEELVILQQSKLVPDNTTVFQEKNLLMKEENNSFININNYEEWLVLYVDNELNTEEKKIVEKFAAAHPHVQTELGLFQQTKLGTENEFSFPNKELLYKREEKVKVISTSWWRIAAAAILIIAAGITMYSVFNKNNSSGPIIITKKEIAGPKKEHAPDPVKSLPDQRQQEQNSITNKVEREQIALITPVNGKPKQKDQQKNKKQPADNLSQSINEQGMVRTNIPEKRPAIVNEINATKPRDPQIRNTVIAGLKMPKQIINDSVVTKPLHQTPDEYASNTGNKRFRGFFRKATRLIERTSGINPANDDDRVLIGGMAINLK